MLKVDIYVTYKKEVIFFSSFGPIFFQQEMLKIKKAEVWRISVQSITGFKMVNSCLQLLRWFIYVFVYLFIFLKKNWDNNFIGPYIWISSALIKKWVLLEQESYLNVKKYLRLWQDFGNWMKNLTIAFMLMVSLCIHIWCDFVTFKSVHANVLFLYLLKSSENLWFSDVFRRYRNGTLVSIYEEHWSITIILKYALNSICQIGNTEPIFSQCTLSLPP